MIKVSVGGYAGLRAARIIAWGKKPEASIGWRAATWCDADMGQAAIPDIPPPWNSCVLVVSSDGMASLLVQLNPEIVPVSLDAGFINGSGQPDWYCLQGSAMECTKRALQGQLR